MKRKLTSITFTLLATIFISATLNAQDTTRIVSHDHIKVVTDPKGENNFLIDLSNYPDGIYMLEFKYGQQTESIRLKKAGMR